MTPEDFKRVDQLFSEAATLPANDRSAFLDNTCNDRPDLRAKVQALLDRDDHPHTLLEHALAPTERTRHQEHTPERIGPYRIIDILGTGGMGIVYRAEQDNPKRTVALKVIRPGFITPQLLHRFQQEADVLARLQHPGIAQIFEAGTTATNETNAQPQPYFAMELVNGRPLLEHANRYHHSTRERIELVTRICDAVEHAHNRGVIHRDLKPTNILVQDVEGESQPKILDFGVARAIGNEVPTTTLQTTVGQLVGTLPYMSPEQLDGDPTAIDQRSDVYALGVILSELLTGRLPHDILDKPLPEAARIIRDDDPHSLSSFDKSFRGDLDTITAKALEKDPDRRYASAAELAADLRRFLVDRPILARRPSTAYQLRKFARRNRTLVAGVVIANLALIAGLIASTILYVRAEDRSERMRRTLYAYSIAVAQGAYESGDAAQLAKVLEECPRDLRHWEWNRLDFLSDQSTHTFHAHTGAVYDIAFFPDSSRVVTGSGLHIHLHPEHSDRTARIWDVQTAKEVITLGAHRNSIRSVAVSADGSAVATLTDIPNQTREAPAGELKLWDAETGSVIRTFTTHPHWSAGLAFGPSANQLFVGGGFAHVAALDLSTLDVRWKTDNPGVENQDIALSPDESVVIGCQWGDGVRCWDANDGAERWHTLPYDRAVHDLDISPDGTTIATVSIYPSAKLLDINDGSVLRSIHGANTPLHAVAYAPDGRIITGAADGAIRIHNADDYAVQTTLLGHREQINQLDVSPDGRWIGSASHDGTAKLWRLDAPSPDIARRPHGLAEVNDVAWSPDGTRLVTAGDDHTACIIDATTGETLFQLPHRSKYVHAVEWLARHQIVTLSSEGRVHLWDPKTGAEVRSWQAHNGFAWALRHVGVNVLFTGAHDGTLKSWALSTGELLSEFAGHTGAIRDIAWKDGGQPTKAHLASVDDKGNLITWNVAPKLQERRTFEHAIDAVAYTPNGKHLVIGDRAGIIRFLHPDTLQTERVIQAHARPCMSIQFTRDGKRMLTAGRDAVARLFDTSTGIETLTLDDHQHAIYAARFDPNDATIATVSADYTLRLWHSQPR